MNNIIKKKKIIKNFSNRLLNFKVLIIAKYKGLTSNELNNLRFFARNNNIYLKILKNNLAKISIKNTIFYKIINELKGSLIYILSNNIILTSKILNDFSKNNKNLKIKFAIYKNKKFNKSKLNIISKIKNRESLVIKIIFILKNFIIYFINILSLIKKQLTI